MCYSEEVSMLTFLVGTFGGILVYSLGTAFDQIIGVYFGYVAFMQLIEWLLWRHQVCDDYHKGVSYTGMMLNGIQPVVLGALILAWSPRTTYKSLIGMITLGYLLFALYNTRHYTSNLQCTQPQTNDPHLVWNWTSFDSFPVMWMVYMSTCFIICLLGMPTLRLGLIFGGGTILSLLISMMVYKRQDVGAMWCFFTNFVPVSYYLLSKLGIAQTIFA